MTGKIVLVDGHSILNRAFYAIPEMTDAKGRHTNAVYGFLNILFKVIDEERPQYLAVAFDRKEPTFRHELFSDYKGTRKGMPEELHEQVPMTKELMAACGIPVLEQPGFEADDILGTVASLAEREGLDVVILSGDRDLLQLATQKVRICIPKTKKGQTVYENYHAEDVYDAYGVTPAEFIELKALMGDSSDNIPGVPGIGEKTGTALIQTYHSVEGVYENLESVKPPRAKKSLEAGRELADLSLKLARICLEAPVDLDLEAAGFKNPYTPAAYDLMKDMGMKSFLRRFGAGAKDAAADNKTNSSDDEKEKTKTEAAAVRVINDAGQAGEAIAALGAAAAGGVLVVQTVSHGGEYLGTALGAKDSVIFISSKACSPAELFPIINGIIGDLAEGDIDPGSNGGANAAASRPFILAAMNLKDMLKLLPFEEDGRWLDAGVAAYLVNPLKHSYGWDDVSLEYLGVMLPSAKDIAGKTKPEELDERQLSEFARCAAWVPMAAAPLLLEKLRALSMEKLYYDIELPLIFSLDCMEKAGVRVEKEALKEYARSMAERIADLEEEIYDLVGHKFNINSPKQLGEILFEEMALPGGKKTKTGCSTAADVLEKLAPFVPVIGSILEYRTLTKLKSTYADGLQDYIGPDGRIHGTFNQTVTATGRISSTEPNLQNIPVRTDLGREIRAMFVPADGCVLIDADYSQIELRILAAMSRDEKLIEAYNEAKDIHAITASQVFHVPLEDVTPELRRNAKAVNFGIVYGISSFGLSEGLSISRSEAAEYIERYFATYPGVKAFLDGMVAAARSKGYVETLYGRRRPVPEIKSSNFNTRSFGERVAMNSPIQGTAADIMKIAMIRVDRRLREEGLRTRIVLQVHDELLLEAPAEEEARASEILVQEMTGAATLAVPLVADVHSGSNWMEAKS